jgi:predicted ATPase
MKKILASNFRKIRDTWELDLAPVTFFTGTNNSGKSTILKSLLLLSDYGSSNNHFELAFDGPNHKCHKIDTYSNAINRINQKEGNWDLNFQFSNKGHSVKLVFTKPINSSNSAEIQKGELERLLITRDSDGAKFELTNLKEGNYQLHIEDRFLERKEASKYKKEIQALLNLQKKATKQIEELNSKITSTNAHDAKSIELRQQLSKLQSNRVQINKRLKEFQDKTEAKFEGVVFSPSFFLYDHDHNKLTIDRVVREVLLPYFKEEEKKIGISSIVQDRVKLMRFSDIVNDVLNFSVEHLSPHRNSQARMYLNNEHSNDINAVINQHAKNPIKKSTKAGIFLKDWMKEFDIGDDYNIIPVHGMATIINVKEDGDWVNLVDKGFGAGQIFTVLLKIAQNIGSPSEIHKSSAGFRIRGITRIILIEEPEANLHPDLQSKLAELFLYAFAKFQIRFVVETHSEYTLRQTQLIVKEIFEKKDDSNNPFNTYYFDKETGPYPMKYRKDGKFINEFGKGFFNESRRLVRGML